jgi:NAD(P)H dehydrogenase (quinone)
MIKNIFILHGDPYPDSLTGELANQYEKAAKEAGFEVRRTNLADIHFDPILRKGYREIQELEPDLKQIQEDMKWANHIVFFYSVWWDSMPSLMKGMFDRMWLPGFAFHFRKRHMGWLRELKGRSARVVMTSGSYPILIRLLYGDPSHVLRKAILWFAGISPIRVTWFGPATKASPEKVNKWRSKAYELGLNGR